jgi:stage II sporulation protein AA (anti-sigma F factor antagonist)
LLQITVTTHGAIVAVEPAGSIDAKASREFERQLLQQLATGTRHVIVDLAKVDLMTSSGIRVLMLLTKRLQADDGALVLCGLNQQMRRAFDVAGLDQRFRFVATQSDAMAALSAAVNGAPVAAHPASKLSRMAARLLAEAERRDGKPPASARPVSSGMSQLAHAVASLLAIDDPAKTPPDPSSHCSTRAPGRPPTPAPRGST